MTVLLLSVAGLVLYLAYERMRIDRWRQCVPQTIIVTGTRGKSSVTRMLAAVLRADGRRVLAKTTGSAPRLLWPDGKETEIKRRGPASILEQKSLLKRAADLKVDCLVAEVMSIHPENHFVETQQVLKPDIVVVTNAHPDHTSAQGESENEIAAILSLDIAEHATAFVPRCHALDVFADAARKANAQLVEVAGESGRPASEQAASSAIVEFPENVDIVHTVACHLGVASETVGNGLASGSRDAGAFSIRELQSDAPKKRLYFVNAFAANDPESTMRTFEIAKCSLPTSSEYVGLLCLRSDRADRTVQWIEALRGGAADRFSRLYVLGGHSRVVERRLDSARRLAGDSVEQLTASIIADADDGTVVFGFGNFVGLGQELAEYWGREGTVHGI